VGYVVMPEHFHLLISEPEKGIPSVMIQSSEAGSCTASVPHVSQKREKPALSAVERSLP